MDKAIEAALREGLGLNDTADVTAAACETAAVADAIATSPRAIDMLYAHHDAKKRAPTATAWLHTLADALSSTGEEQ